MSGKFSLLLYQVWFSTYVSVSGMSCMSANCDTLAPDEFVLRHVNKEQVRDKYNQLTFQDHVRSHPQLR